MKLVNYGIVDIGSPYECGQFMGDAARYCDAPLEGQEDISCWREKGHAGPHESICAWPICPSCSGLDMHDEDCEKKDYTTNDSRIVQWMMTPGPRCKKKRYEFVDYGECGLHEHHEGPHRDGARAWMDKEVAK